MQLSALKYVTKKALPLLLLCFSVASFAQSRFEMAARGGAAMLLYQSEAGSLSPSYNFGVDLMYSYRSPKVVGVRVGASIDFAQSVFGIANYKDSYSCIDYNVPTSMSGVGGDKLNFRYGFESVTEAHNMIFASVPVMLTLNFGNFSMALGPKFSVPLRSTFKQDICKASASVEYPDYGVVIDAYQWPVYNLHKEKATSSSFSGDIANTIGLRPYDFNVFASIDLNYYVPLSKKSSFGIGLYCDYMIPRPDNASLTIPAGYLWKSGLMYLDDPTSATSAPMWLTHTSMLDANFVNGASVYNKSMQLIKAVNYLSAGIRLSYSIGGVRKIPAKHWYKGPNKNHCNCIEFTKTRSSQSFHKAPRNK